MIIYGSDNQGFILHVHDIPMQQVEAAKKIISW